MTSELTDQIHGVAINEIISRYISLSRAGAGYKASCPFHDEKSASFMVDPRRNIFKCFGCGKGGDGISFVMEHQHVDFIQACKIINQDFNLNIDFKNEYTPDPEVVKRRERLISLMHLAQQFYMHNLYSPAGNDAMQYIKSRFDDETIKLWGIGYAGEEWNAFQTEAAKLGFSDQELIDTGMISRSKEKLFDTFRGRIMFPVVDQHGSVIAFSGRMLPGLPGAKYINSRETELYVKGNNFFGINYAIAEIRKTRSAYLVEGNPDVIRMQQIGPVNTIAPMGTGLSDKQADWLKNNCNSVTIIGDSDPNNAGSKAATLNAEKLIKKGLFVNIIPLPVEEGVKHDPDSFFRDHEFSKYTADNCFDFIIWHCTQIAPKASRPEIKQRLISSIAELIACYPSGTQELYIEQVAALVKPKKAWVDELKSVVRYTEPETKTIDIGDCIPDTVNIKDFEKYRFYEDHNQYFFRTKNGIVRGANFAMRPLFHVQSVLEAKRIFEIINEYGYSQVIEFAQRDLVSLQSFRLRVESLGNFLWEATELEFIKLKRFIYENTETCTEIKQLGWQKHGFWAWGNGIFNGTYSPANEYGIVKHNDINYYIPAFSKIYTHEDSLFISERKFVHQPGTISMADLIQKIEDTFGPNAEIAYCFYLATCFRDFIVARFGFFPILNMFGPKGAGKTEMALTMLHFFGKSQKGPNINNTSKAALADHIAQHSNALCHIDEYKNNIEFEKIEFLKGIWDGTGRTRMNMDKDKKKETTNVDIGLMLTGQEMPTADIALFSRLIFLMFNQTEYNDAEKERFNELKDILNAGVTHLTHQVLANRAFFIENYFDNYDKVCTRFNELLGDVVIEDRIFRNWAIVVAAFTTLCDKIPTFINTQKLFTLAVDLLMRQNTETKRTNDVANFWEIVNFLIKEGELVEKVDFKIKPEITLTINQTDVINFDQPTNILYLNHTRIFQKYREHGAHTRDFVLPVKTLEYYLMNSKEYLGRKASCPFIMLQGSETEPNFAGKLKRQITTAHTFVYDLIVKNYGVNFTTTEIDDDEDDNSTNKAPKADNQANNNDLFKNTTSDLPF